jgi:hypothetical protein
MTEQRRLRLQLQQLQQTRSSSWRLIEAGIRAKDYYKAVWYGANDWLMMISERERLENRASEVLERLVEEEEEPE